MMSPVYDTTLSATIMNVTGSILPYTAEGKALPAHKARDIVIELSHALKLASLLEREIAILRSGEANAIARALESEATAALESKIVQVDFDKGRKS
ncbi:hypothetical protein [Shinella pollutisoli]|uniref:Uncharacterized protein n=1 Tax=Shinella pollutisoli TaxID=2250594 RepID=A0ABV7DIY7_9HYPH|nr:hypothetical protein [Shinella pollutisoli]